MFCTGLNLPDFLSELASLEETYFKVKTSDIEVPQESDEIIINPSLELVRHNWHFAYLFNSNNRTEPQKGEQWIIIWRDPRSAKVFLKAAIVKELLALKIIAEQIPITTVAHEKNLTIGKVQAIIRDAIQKTIFLGPASSIKRDKTIFSNLAARILYRFSLGYTTSEKSRSSHMAKQLAHEIASRVTRSSGS